MLIGGYAATVVLSQPRKEVAALFLSSLGKLSSAQNICSFRTDAYAPNLWWDSKREEIYFTCQIERHIFAGQYVVVLTKKNATGAHAANTPTQRTKNVVGYTDKQNAHIQGYYNPRLDR